MKFIFKFIYLGILAILFLVNSALAVPVVRFGSGANAAAIQATVDQFRADLGGALNPNNGQSFQTGRREINWDGVPDNFAAPNLFPPNFFNVNSPRGVVLVNDSNTSTPDSFQVSSKAASGTAVRFGNIDASYTGVFQTFSPERLFVSRASNETEIEFFIPGTNVPATVSGFGVVFADVDNPSNTFVKMYAADGTKIAAVAAPAFNGGLSFIGVSFNAGERVAKVVIQSGNAALASGAIDGADGVDVVAMDDFIYGEPRAAQFHAGDFDGDGFADPSVFRPSSGTFFVLNSGSSTINQLQFGLAGDVPVAGDFDGDSRADVAVFRPGTGEWWINRSSNGSVVAAQFGESSDKPTPGDFDKDGKTDIAFWRPSSGSYFVLRSRDGSFFSFPWGLDGDLPVGAAK